MNCLWLLILILMETSDAYDNVISMSLRMPNIRPTLNDSHLCTAIRMPTDVHYIVEFAPNSSAEVHHGEVVGCQQPGYYQPDDPTAVWDCSDMPDWPAEFVRSGFCGDGRGQSFYAWKKNAPKMTLLQGVGFQVGGDSGFNFLVLQVHYANIDKFMNGEKDSSGVVVSMVPKNDKPMKRAGIFSLATFGTIPPDSVEHMEVACRFPDPISIHPFAFLAHAHQLGRVVSGYRIRSKKESRLNEWSLIGKHAVEEMQMFNPITNNLTIEPGDRVAVRCTIDNWKHNEIRWGLQVDHEMCLYSIMYYVDGDDILDNWVCSSLGPPAYYWNTDNNVGPVPKQIDIEASQLN